MKLVAAVVVLLLSGGCAISDEYAVAYSRRMDEFQQQEQRWESGPQSEPRLRWSYHNAIQD